MTWQTLALLLGTAAALATAAVNTVWIRSQLKRQPVSTAKELTELGIAKNGAAGQVAAAAYRWYLDTIEHQRAEIMDLRKEIAGVRLELEEAEQRHRDTEAECDRRIRELHERIGRLSTYGPRLPGTLD